MADLAISDLSGRRDASRHLWLSLRRALLVPRVALLSRRTPKHRLTGWEHYWSRIRRTGVGGDVLWDSADLGEFAAYPPLITQHLDTSLPIIDIGCGNGRFTRHLAPLFPSVLGMDLSSHAIALARRESAEVSNLRFRTLDITVPHATDSLRAEIGPANVFVRGVFHILDEAERLTAAGNLLPLVGSQGRLLLAETDFRGSALGYLESLGATPRRIPAPLERAIRYLPRPGHFGELERAATFRDEDWQLVVDGPLVIETIPLRGTSRPETIPGYVAVLAPRG